MMKNEREFVPFLDQHIALDQASLCGEVGNHPLALALQTPVKYFALNRGALSFSELPE